MSKSETLFKQACQHIPGGVNSPVRAFKGVGGNPIFFSRGEGPYLFDADNKRYVDYVASWGPMIAGHHHPDIIAAVQQAITNGLGFGAPTEIEIRMADLLCELVPSLEQVRMVNSGTEATMSAIRLARGFTGRDKIIKFEGCYHGHSDSLLVKAGSGALTLGVPTSPGVPADLAQHTITLSYNDREQVREVFAEIGDSIAAVIVEPVAGNMNCIPPEPGFLEVLRESCDAHASVLIFDEVMTGFRVALDCAQGRFGVTPDLTTLGKIIGGGLPVGAFGGRRDIMQQIAPEGPVYQAGTLSGNPVAMAAGLATLSLVQQENFYPDLEHATNTLLSGLKERAETAKINFSTNQVGAMFGLFFTDADKVRNFADVSRCNVEQFQKFFHFMLEQGVYLAPSAYEAGFVSSAHDETALHYTLDAAEKAFASLATASDQKQT